MVAHGHLARQAPADGHTIGIVSSGLFADSMLRAQGLGSHADLEIIGFINYDATNWIVSTSGPLAELDLREILVRARLGPETVRISMLPQSSSEFLAEQAETRSGARFLKVPFQGGVPGMTAMLGGHVDIATVFYSEYRGQMAAGAVRPVAVASAGRQPNMPEVPTFNEVLGAQNMLWAAWRFAVVPKAVQPDRRDYLAAVIRAAARDPDAAQEFTQAGVLLDPSLDSPEAVRTAADQLVTAQQDFFRESGRLR
jgi:tripartite-type tricarboxylate transporter receptor subunit TctC